MNDRAAGEASSGGRWRTIILPFLTFTLIWGGTWIVIRGQLDTVAPQWSVAYRFAIAAVVWSVKYIVAVVKTKQRRNMSLGILGGLLSIYLIFSAMSSVILWPVQSKYEECLRDAITQQAQLSCSTEYQSGLGDWFKQVTGQELDLPGTN